MAIGRDRISAILAPFFGPERLSHQQLGLVESYLALLLKWNSRINLTAVRDPEEIVARHFGESLFAARQLLPFGSEPLAAIDLGSGAGFPGIPLKIWNAALSLTLIEANQRKATFLREVIRALELLDAKVLAERAEAIASKADLVTLRAVERFDQVIPIGRRLLNPGGRLALLIGDSQAQTAKQSLTEMRWQPLIPIPLSRSRILLVGTAED
jgi:16S rRNA (guanine527-N7)-methyltransferase